VGSSILRTAKTYDERERTKNSRRNGVVGAKRPRGSRDLFQENKKESRGKSHSHQKKIRNKDAEPRRKKRIKKKKETKPLEILYKKQKGRKNQKNSARVAHLGSKSCRNVGGPEESRENKTGRMNRTV